MFTVNILLTIGFGMRYTACVMRTNLPTTLLIAGPALLSTVCMPARVEYGKGVLQALSAKLIAEFGEGFSVRNLQHMRRFYLCYPIANTVCSQLSWSHYRLLLKVEDSKARKWYEDEAIRCQWSCRQLDRQISTLYYERLISSADKGPVVEEAAEKLLAIQPQDFIKDPYVLEFLDIKQHPSLRESSLEQALIDNLQHFLLELGRGFCFVARQKLMRFDDDDFYLDLVFYHSVLKCYVLIDLKVGRLSHGDVGQMDSYIRMFDTRELLKTLQTPVCRIILDEEFCH